MSPEGGVGDGEGLGAEVKVPSVCEGLGKGVGGAFDDGLGAGMGDGVGDGFGAVGEGVGDGPVEDEEDVGVGEGLVKNGDAEGLKEGVGAGDKYLSIPLVEHCASMRLFCGWLEGPWQPRT